MSRVSAKPPPDAMTQRQAQALGLVAFLSMAICRKGTCDTFVRVTRTLQCVACKEREAPRLAALADIVKAKAKVARTRAASRARKEAEKAAAKAIKDAERTAAREARANFRRAAKWAAAKATRAAIKAAAAGTQERVQTALQQPDRTAPHQPPWEGMEVLTGNGVECVGVPQAGAAVVAPWEDADGDEGPPW